MSAASNPVTETETSEKTGHYPRYKVFIHNDDQTTFMFVIVVIVLYNRQAEAREQTQSVLMELKF